MNTTHGDEETVLTTELIHNPSTDRKAACVLMDASAARRRESEGSSASDLDWASDDISVLAALLETPTQRRREDQPQPQRRRRHWMSTSDDGLAAFDRRGHEEDEDKEEKEDAESSVDHVTVTALKRQVELLQQEYDRQLEQRVAKSVIAAGGRSAPRAATIKLYRQYERLARVAAALEMENLRLAALLTDRQTQQQQQQSQPQRMDQIEPFQVAVQSSRSDSERIPRSQITMFQADAKEPVARRSPEREEIPRSASE